MPADDKRRATAALADLVERCSPVLRAGPDTPPACHLILADVDALLARLDALAARLALVLKPPSPAYAPSVPVLCDLAQHTSALVFATRLLRDDLHGATLAALVRRHVNQIMDALRALAQSLLAAAQDYLLRTATLFDLIATIRASIPSDNQTAVRHAWGSDKDALEDNLQEVANIVQQAESLPAQSDMDDGWDEIGLAHTTHLDSTELARAKKVHRVLRLTTLLHKRILLDLLPFPSPVPLSAFDTLLIQSNQLLVTSDNLVAALYSPQDPDHVREEILLLIDITTSLQSQLIAFLPATDQLTQQCHAISLASTVTPPTSTPKKRADKQWFDTCVDQIVRSCSSLTEENPNSATNTAHPTDSEQ